MDLGAVECSKSSVCDVGAGRQTDRHQARGCETAHTVLAVGCAN
jgi:hypothetical protein